MAPRQETLAAQPHLCDLGPLEHSTQPMKTQEDAADNANLFLRWERPLANLSPLKGSQNLSTTSWMYRHNYSNN